MIMRESKKKRLREAWHGPLTAEQIARANAVGPRWLRRFWNDERAAGRLPAEPAPRPHFASHSKPAIIVGVEEAEADIADLDDASPIFDPNPNCRTQSDALLAALREHHADTDRPAAHKAPRAWLKCDVDPFYAPGRRSLRAMAIAFDNGAFNEERAA